MYCPNCGSELEENAEFCPTCGTSLIPTITHNKRKIVYDPLTMVATVFSVVAFVLGFIILTTAFAVKKGSMNLDYFAIIPAFVGLGISIYKRINKPEEKLMNTLTVVNLILCCFTILYAFAYTMYVIT